MLGKRVIFRVIEIWAKNGNMKIIDMHDGLLYLKVLGSQVLLDFFLLLFYIIYHISFFADEDTEQL